MQKCKVLESEYAVERPWLAAKCDSLELPDGRTALAIFLHM